MILIDGEKIAAKILKDIKKEIKKLPVKPGLAVILVGEDKASKIYIKKKEKKCEEVGIKSEKFIFKKSATSKIIKLIKKLNNKKDINGILVQLPLPKNLDADKIIKTIDIKKDVDGFLKKSKVAPPTIAGILELLKYTKINLKNKTATILANSRIFANPLKNLLEKEGCSVKVLIKPKRQNFNADIIVSALGKPKFIKSNMVKDNVIIIDVGITRIDKKIYGDADQKSLQDKSGWITPVPGGVGPMTVAMLLKNLLLLSEKINNINKK